MGDPTLSLLSCIYEHTVAQDSSCLCLHTQEFKHGRQPGLCSYMLVFIQVHLHPGTHAQVQGHTHSPPHTQRQVDICSYLGFPFPPTSAFYSYPDAVIILRRLNISLLVSLCLHTPQVLQTLPLLFYPGTQKPL